MMEPNPLTRFDAPWMRELRHLANLGGWVHADYFDGSSFQLIGDELRQRGPIDVVANAIRAADGNHTAGTELIAEVAVAEVCKHIAEFQNGDRSTDYRKGWNDSLGAVLATLGHGGA
jgi:hypothetical protein